MNINWNNYPNANQIKRVLNSLKANPALWTECRTRISGDARFEIQIASSNAIGADAWSDAHAIVALSMPPGHAWDPVWYAILALIGYPDCVYMLDSDPSELAILAAFGDPRATAMLGACKVFAKEKALV